MKVIGFRNYTDTGALPHEQYVHLAVLACGHTRRMSDFSCPNELTCDENCDDGGEAQDSTPSLVSPRDAMADAQRLK